MVSLHSPCMSKTDQRSMTANYRGNNKDVLEVVHRIAKKKIINRSTNLILIFLITKESQEDNSYQ